MNERDEHVVQIATDRFARRLAEETGKLRVDMANGFGELRTEMATGMGALRAESAGGMGALRAEMVERNHELLKWALVFWATQVAAIGGLLAVFR
jgi:hypothetical protein